MINEYYAKKFCCEDLSLIENYDIAVADTTQTWDCHHRRGTIYTVNDLIEIGEYYHRPAIELIFLTPSAHRSLHNNGVPKHYLKGIPLSEAHKKAIGDANSKKVLQLTKAGEFVREWPSLCEAERELGIARSSICKCCNGICKYASGYIWKYV